MTPRALVLAAIQERPGIDRAEINRVTGLFPGIVLFAIQELPDLGAIVRCGEGWACP